MSAKKTLLGLTLFFGLLSINPQAFCMMRTDLDDRTPQEVVKKSLHLAQQGDYSHVTGVVLVRTEKDILSGTDSFSRYGTGVALDPYTVLTAAHYILDDFVELLFVLHPNFATSTGEHIWAIPSALPHPTFSDKKVEEISVTFQGRDPYLKNIPLSGLTYPQVDQGPLNKLRGYIGVDLTILKLQNPLPENLIFPEILPLDYNVKDTYGICLGYGQMMYNYQDKGPTRVIDDHRMSIQRHLISSKVTAYTSVDKGPVLYGNYKGLMIHGNESFIPDPTMQKTEGMVICGDSGGPFFINHEGKYKLAGIASYVWSAMGEPILDQELALKLKDITQPVFPVWVDIRSHMEEIKELMGY